MRTSLSGEFLCVRRVTKIFDSLRRPAVGVAIRDIGVEAEEAICLTPPGIPVLTPGPAQVEVEVEASIHGPGHRRHHHLLTIRFGKANLERTLIYPSGSALGLDPKSRWMYATKCSFCTSQRMR